MTVRLSLTFWTLLVQAVLVVAVAGAVAWLTRAGRALWLAAPSYGSRAELEADYERARIDVHRYLAEKERLGARRT